MIQVRNPLDFHHSQIKRKQSKNQSNQHFTNSGYVFEDVWTRFVPTSERLRIHIYDVENPLLENKVWINYGNTSPVKADTDDDGNPAPIKEVEYDQRFDHGADVSVMESLGGPSLLIEKQRQAAVKR